MCAVDGQKRGFGERSSQDLQDSKLEDIGKSKVFVQEIEIFFLETRLRMVIALYGEHKIFGAARSGSVRLGRVR